VGYSDGFDTEDGYAICAKIAERNDADWADFDYLNMPWNTYSDNGGSTGVFEGDVYDTNIEIIPGEDYTQDAQWLADSYATIRNLLDEGMLTIEASCGKKSVKASNNKGKRAITAMRLTRDFSEFRPWSGAVDTWNTLMDYDKLDELEALLDSTYIDENGEGIMSETELNDLLWFEPETVCEWVGLYYNDETGEISDTPFDDADDIEESVRAKGKKSVKAASGAPHYELFDYFDVWGNAEDGWEVNDVAKIEDDIVITDDASDDEILDYLINTIGWLSPDAKGKVRVENNGDGIIEFFQEEDDYPLGSLQRKW
jgi:hypothetical protein